MAMITEPNEEDIGLFLAITGSSSRSSAIQWLKAHNNDTNSATNAWLDNPGDVPPQHRWEEGPFHSDKTADHQQPQSQIEANKDSWREAEVWEGMGAAHGSTTLNPNVFADGGAPSRPPSRVSNRGLAIASSAQQPMNRMQEDDDLNRAVALSMNDSQTLPGQETGVTGYTKPTLKPATRDFYHMDNWALVPRTQTQEILLNPEPTDRKRQPGVPAFFKPSASGHRLPALLKIMHAIPMAREALLNRSHTLGDYGRESDWWDGTTIKVLRVVNVDQEGRETEHNDVVYETQRLMAFLDETERAYGSTDVLGSLEGIQPYENGKVARFLQEWTDAASRCAKDQGLVKTFLSVGSKKELETEEPAETEEMHCIAINVESEIANKGQTLYEAIDYVLWNFAGDDEICLDKVADVLVFEVKNDNQSTDDSGLGIAIPAVWYSDRYLLSSKEEAKQMRARKAAVKSKVEAMEEVQANLTTFKRPGTNPGTYQDVDASHILSKTTAYFEQTAIREKATEDAHLTDVTTPASDSILSPSTRIAEELKAISERIARKLQTFKKVREDAREKLNEISQLYTTPSDDSNEPPHHEYTLRGVSTDPHTVYILEKTQPENDYDMLDFEAMDWQWWKLEYVTKDSKPVVTTKVTEPDVLKAASTESRAALLVYASTAAMSYPTEPLPSQLHNFVRADNLSFNAELSSPNLTYPSPPKRKAISDDDDDDNDNDDLIVEHPRSPPYDRDHSLDDFDQNPPEYDDSDEPPPLLDADRAGGRVEGYGGFDDLIPLSVQSARTTVDPSSMTRDGKEERGVEMQERGGRSLLDGHGFNDPKPYELGSYLPEMRMEDEEEDEDQTGAM